MNVAEQHELLVGSHTMGEQHYLMVASVNLPSEDAVIDNRSEKEEKDGKEGEGGEKNMIAFITTTRTFKYKHLVNTLLLTVRQPSNDSRIANKKRNANWPSARLRALDSYRVNFAAVSSSGLAETMAKGSRPSAAPLLPAIIADKDEDNHHDVNDGIVQNC